MLTFVQQLQEIIQTQCVIKKELEVNLCVASSLIVSKSFYSSIGVE